MKRRALSVLAVVLAALPAVTPAAAQSWTLRPILVENFCHRAINLWVSHADGWRNWHGHGEFTIAGYGSTYLSDYGVRLTQRTDHDIYYYAETIDGSLTWEGGLNQNVNGYSLPMRQQGYVLRNGAYAIRLTC